MSDLTGQRFGNYRLIRLLGQGGFADTYLGEQIYVGTSAAVKIVQTRLAQGDQKAFFGEARTIAHLTHPNIVRLLDFGVESSRNISYLVMDYAPNGTLRQRHSRGEVVPVSRVVSYLKQLAAALQYAHEQKVIHRDVKPENMLVGAGNEVLLTDFGIAVVESTHTQTQMPIAGTIYYMAPEQIQGKPLPASDQYALAVVVYEWLCGGPPFTGSYPEVAVQHECSAPPSLRERVATIPVEVEQVVLTALAKDPQQRFKDVQTFAYALEQASHMGLSPSLHPSPADSQMNLPTVPMPYPSAIPGHSGPSQVSADRPPQIASGRQPVHEPESPAAASSEPAIPSPSDLRNPHTPVPAVHESFEPGLTPQFTPPLKTPLHTPVQEPLSTPSSPSHRWRPSTRLWRPSTRLTVLPGVQPAPASAVAVVGQEKALYFFDAERGTPCEIRYSGMARLPKKVFEGDSQNISLTLDRKSFIKGLHSETLNIEDTPAGKQVTLNIQKEDNREQFLEVELLAAALSINGEKKQKQSLTLEKLAYHWNCQFKSAGEHEICLVLNVIRPSGERYLGRIEQTIHVVKFDHATQHQVQVGAAVTGAGALLGTIATILATVLGIWHPH